MATLRSTLRFLPLQPLFDHLLISHQMLFYIMPVVPGCHRSGSVIYGRSAWPSHSVVDREGRADAQMLQDALDSGDDKVVRAFIVKMHREAAEIRNNPIV
jgi:hypothetical protein